LSVVEGKKRGSLKVFTAMELQRGVKLQDDSGTWGILKKVADKVKANEGRKGEKGACGLVTCAVTVSD